MSRLPIDRVLSEITEREVVDLTAQLVRIPSVHRPGEPGANEQAVAREVAAVGLPSEYADKLLIAA